MFPSCYISLECHWIQFTSLRRRGQPSKPIRNPYAGDRWGAPAEMQTDGCRFSPQSLPLQKWAPCRWRIIVFNKVASLWALALTEPWAMNASRFAECRGIRAFAYLARLKVVLHAVLEPLAFGLEGRHNQAVAHKVCWIANAFAGAEAVYQKKKKEKKEKLECRPNFEKQVGCSNEVSLSLQHNLFQVISYRFSIISHTLNRLTVEQSAPSY